jgi:hypothetical protein
MIQPTAKDPGALRAAVHPQPRYKPKPSSAIILATPLPRKASGFVCRLIFKTSKGSITISPMPIKLGRWSLAVDSSEAILCFTFQLLHAS